MSGVNLPIDNNSLSYTELLAGTVLVSLHEHFPSFTFKAIVRSDSAVDALKSSGLPVEPIKGSHTDAELVKRHVKEADVVVTCADSDNKEFVPALLEGLKAHFDEGRGVSKLVHTSGSAIYWDGRIDGKTDPNGKIWTVSCVTLHINPTCLKYVCV